MTYMLEAHTIGFDPKRDRATGVILSRDLRGGLKRTPVTAAAHPRWGWPRVARALTRAAERRIDPHG